MSTTDFDPEDYEGVQPKQVQMSRADIRALEKKAKLAEQAQAELEQLRRERAFLRAGIADDGKLGTLFIKGYEGDLSDADAIRTAAIEYGVLAPSPEQQASTQQSLAGHQAAVEASAGAQATTGNEDLLGLMKQAKSAQEVARLMHDRGVHLIGGDGKPLIEGLR